MRSSRFFFASLLLLAVALGLGRAAACSSSSSATTDSPLPTAEGGPEPAEAGAGPDDTDGGDRRSSTGKSDARRRRSDGDILGTLASGACGIIKNELTQATPSLENNVLVFVAGETYDKASLSPGGQRMFDTANAGGSSTESEAMSYEVLRYCEGATLLHTETRDRLPAARTTRAPTRSPTSRSRSAARRSASASRARTGRRARPSPTPT